MPSEKSSRKGTNASKLVQMAREAATEENDGDTSLEPGSRRRRSLVDFSDEIKVVRTLAAEAEKKVRAKEQVCAFVGPVGVEGSWHLFRTHSIHVCSYRAGA